MRTQSRLLLVLVAALALLAAGCGDDDSGGSGQIDAEVVENPEFPEGSTMARLADAGSIRIGVKYDQPGLGNLNPETDEPEGFDIEVGAYIAGQLGIARDDIEFIETISANREPAITNDQVDIVIATYTINDERKQVVDFAGPYYFAGQDLLVAEDDDSINGPDDLAGKRVCAASGSTPIENIRENYPQSQPVEFDTYTQCVDQLADGAIDAVSTDNIILAGYAAEPRYEGQFRVVGETFSEEPYGIGLPKGDDAFRQFLNDTLQQMFEDGMWEEAFDATLGASGEEAPEPPELDRY